MNENNMKKNENNFTLYFHKKNLTYSYYVTGSTFHGKHLAQRDFVASNSYNEESNIVVNVLIVLCVHFIKYTSLINFSN